MSGEDLLGFEFDAETMAGVIVRRREQNRILYTLKDARIRTMIEFLRVQFLDSEQKVLV